jgi:ATP-dependent Clp protease ATP-binding subunit ClpA
VDWKDAPFGKLQALPRDDKPVSLWRDRDDAFNNVVRGIREAIEIPIDEALLAVLNLQKEKCQRQNVTLNTAHLLLALLEIHNGVTQRALDTLKPDLAATLQSQLERYTAHLPSMGGIKPYSKKFQWEDLLAVQKARQWAQKDGNKKITERHLLLGFLGAESSTLESLKRRLGDDLSKLIQIVQDISDEASGTSGTPGIDTFI